MTAICTSAIHLCRVRITRLDELGNPTAGPNNVIVTDKPMMLNVNPVIEAGQDRTLTGGCDCIVATYRGNDKLKRFDLELDLATLEPTVMEMLIGADIIEQAGVRSGIWWPSNLTCSQVQQPLVCVEGWQTAWDVDHQADAPYQYVHWLFPATKWQIGNLSLQNDFNQPKLMGYSRGNTNWGDGIFGDLPEPAGPLGGYLYTDTIPDAHCDYQSWAIT